MEKSLKKNVLSGVIWQYVQRLGNQSISFIVSIILARLLVPEDFGTVALLGVFISISNIFIDSGFGNALIQSKEIDDTDCSSVFYLNIGVSLLIYSIVFCIAPWIEEFYAMPQLSLLLRVLALQIVMMAIGCVQSSLLIRWMKFHINFYIGITSTILSSIVGISLAYFGFGVWSIVTSQLTSQLCIMIGLWILVGWRPKLVFSIKRILCLFSYGSRILAGSLISVICNNIFNLVIGKRYTAVDLGFYNRGQLLPNTIIDTAANSVNGVLFPALSSIQNNRERHKSVIRRSEKMISFIVFFISAMMLALSTDIVKFLLGEKWLPAVPFMRIVCLTLCLSPISVLNQSIQTTLGRSDIYLKTTIWSKTVAILLIIIGSYVNVYIMVLAGTVASFCTFFITGIYNKQLIGYSFIDQMRDIAPAFFLSILSGIAAYGVSLLGMNVFMNLIIGAFTGSFLYFGLAYILKYEAMLFLADNIRQVYFKIK